MRFYEVNLWVFKIAYHWLNIQLHSWHLLFKRKKIRGFQKCKVHCCNFKGFKVTSIQRSAWLEFEPGPSAWVNFPMLSDWDKRGQEPSCMFIYDMLSGTPIGLLLVVAIVCNKMSLIVPFLQFFTTFAMEYHYSTIFR